MLQFGTPDYTGRAALFLPKEALASRSGGSSADGPIQVDPAVAATLSNVEMEVVVELGRLPIRLGQLSNLKVGDTLKLDVAVGGLVKVRAGSRELLKGRPTTQGGQIAIRIEAGHDD